MGLLMKIRPYQQETLDRLHTWWMERDGHPILTLPTGSGKSIIIAELVRLLFDTYADDHPRTVVIVPSKELAEQNAEKLRAIVQGHLTVGYYSASLGKRCPDADIIVATIGTVANSAHLLGNIKCVIIDECHLTNNNGGGRYRQFLADLARYCKFRCVGLTATPFRGDGVYLTDGEDPFFNGVAHTVTMQSLIDAGYLSTLIRPIDVIETRVKMDGVKTTGGDYNLGETADRVSEFIPEAAREVVTIAADRKKWIAFLPTVETAEQFVNELQANGISAALVCGDTQKDLRVDYIKQFRSGEIRCLVTVLALATGFDVPDVDCVVWLRPTISPVLYVQGAGRGTRIAEGKTDCLWVDFTDTTARLGAVDAIKGHAKRKNKKGIAPQKICEACGELCHPRAKECTSCGAIFPEDKHEAEAKASEAPILSSQIKRIILDYDVTSVEYFLHRKAGSPDSVRVEYFSGFRQICCDWLCFDHGGFAREKAKKWWQRSGGKLDGIATASAWVLLNDGFIPNHPVKLRVDETGKFSKIIAYKWREENATT
jgi:DNA repair protein RadD